MMTGEFKACFDKLAALWPTWKPEPPVYEAWLRMLGRCEREPFEQAIQLHFEERHEKKNWQIAPDEGRLRTLYEKQKESATGYDAEREAAWAKLDPLEKARRTMERCRELLMPGAVLPPGVDIVDIKKALARAEKMYAHWSRIEEGSTT